MVSTVAAIGEIALSYEIMTNEFFVFMGPRMQHVRKESWKLFVAVKSPDGTTKILGKDKMLCFAPRAPICISDLRFLVKVIV